jgi:hypothetical protein
MYRAIDTEVWDDTWFADLEPDGKLLFLYLLTNRRTTACGAFEISVRMIVNETGIDAARVEELIGSFNPRVLWFRDANLIWVRNFFRRQYKNANEKQVAALRSSLAAFPPIVTDAFRKEYPYLFNEETTPPMACPEPMDSLSIGDSPITVTVEGTVTASEQEAEHENALPRAVVSDTPYAVFAAFVEETAEPDFVPAPAWKKQQIGIASNLLEQGFGADKVRRCVRFMRSQSWRTSPFDLKAVSGYIGTWEAAGMPEIDKPQRQRPSKNTVDTSGIDTVTALWKQQEARR